MKAKKTIAETSIDPLSGLVASQAEARPAPAPNIEQLIADELRPEPAEAFDPALHETDPATGGPLWTADFKLKRKRGRKPGQRYAVTDQGGELPEGELAAPMTRDQARAEAELLCSMAFGSAVSLQGPTWEPEPDERRQITDALAQYIFTTGGIGLPAWATVALAFGSYAIRRTRIGQMVGLPAPEPLDAEPEPLTLPTLRGNSNSPKPPVSNAA